MAERIRHFINQNKQKTINEKRYYKDINESLNEYLSNKRLNNKKINFECECKNNSASIQKQIKIMEPPPIMLLHLDRFGNSKNFFEGQELCVSKGKFGLQVATIIMVKDARILIVYSHLTYNHNSQNVTEWINKNEYQSRIRDYKIIKYPVSNLNIPGFNEYKYDLIAICNHNINGKDITFEFDNYTAYVKHHKNQKWYETDNEKVREMDSVTDVISKNAIALLYKRKRN